MADLDAAGIDSATLSGGILSSLARAQYGALARLRWHMFSNGIRTNKGMLEMGARTFSFIVYALMGVGLGVGTGFVTYLLASGEKWRFLPILFWVVTFLWQMIPIMLASFQEQFDLGILLRFPVRFGSYVLLYLVFGLVDISTILGGLCCAGIWVGISVARPSLLLWATLDLAMFAAFNILLVRAIFAWIDRWLAQRKTREILGAVFMIVILGLQLLNPALYQKRHSGRNGPQAQAEQLRAAKERYTPLLKKANSVQMWLPPGLAAAVMQEAVGKDAQQTGAEVLGMLGLYALLAGGILALRLKGEYCGENLGSAPTREKAAAGRVLASAASGLPAAARADAAYKPDSSGPIAAIVEKDVRSLLRTMPLLYAMGAPLLLVLVFSGVFIKNGGGMAPVFPFALPLCMVYAQLGFTQIFYNNLGTEGAGVQLYFLSPTPMRTVLLAKNILHASLFAMVALMAGVLTSLRLGTPDPAIIAGTAAWVLFSLPCNLAVGNVFSLKMPYRVNPGRIARQRGSQANALLSLLAQLAVLAVGAAVFALTWALGDIVLATPIFILLAVAALYVWWIVLGNANAMANERRDALMATLMKQS